MLALLSSFIVEGNACDDFEKHMQHYQSDFNSSYSLKHKFSQSEQVAVVTSMQSTLEKSKRFNRVPDLKLKVNNINIKHNLSLSFATLNLMQLWAQQNTSHVVLLTNASASNNLSELQLYRALLMNEAYIACQLQIEKSISKTPKPSLIEHTQTALFKSLFSILNTLYRNVDNTALQKLIDLRALQIDYLLKRTLVNLGYKRVVEWESIQGEDISNNLYFSLLDAFKLMQKIKPNDNSVVPFQIINMGPEDELLAEYVLITLLHIELQSLNVKSINDLSPPPISFIGQTQTINSANKSIFNILSNLLRLTEEES
ncbi:hypothetical protein N9L48_02730 [Psychrosphaera sp.]|nr:hypothetical protein [Psychrosphaera sp.]